MAFGPSVLWGVALIGYAMISLIQGAYEVKYRCAFDSTVGSIGKFSVEFHENGVDFLAAGTFYALVDVTTGELCGSALAETTTGSGANEITTFPDQSVIPTAALPCGVVEVAGGAATDYTFTIVTQTLSTGFTTLDKYYTMTCDFVATRDVDVVSTAVATPSVGAGPAPTELTPGITLAVFSRTAPAAFDAVAAGGAVAFGDDLQIKITFDQLTAAGVEFYVKSCYFEAISGPVTRTVDIVKAYAGPKYCISADAETLGFGTAPAGHPLHGFSYAIAGTDYVGTSSSFEVFSLFVKSGAAAPIPMTLKCSVTYCLAGCEAAPACAGTVLTKRRKRSAEEDPKTATVEAVLTVVPQGDPRANKSQGNGSGATTECAMFNMGYLVGLIVLAAMLLFTVATTIFMYARLNRRRNTETTKA